MLAAASRGERSLVSGETSVLGWRSVICYTALRWMNDLHSVALT